MFPRLHLALATVVLLTSVSFAGSHGKKKTLNGYLVDISCATERASELGTLGVVHTRQCLQMPDCQRSGYGLLTDDKKILRFDAAGNDQVKQLIASTDQPKDFRITVSGRVQKDQIEVSKLTLLP
jgi:hypothetical protein